MAKFLFAALLLSAGLVQPVRAWHNAEHKTVAEIAWREMTPAARARAVQLLFAAPEDSGVRDLCPIIFDVPSVAEQHRQFFLNSSIWADLLNDPRFPDRRQKYNAWHHYIDNFFRGTSGTAGLRNAAGMPAPNEKNAVRALFAADKTLNDKNVDDAAKGLALAWFLHIAGDLHQPLHAASRVTDLDPGGDKGGNAFLLAAPDALPEKADRERNLNRRMNLHRWWDGVYIRSYAARTNEPDSVYVPRIAAEFTKKYPARNYRNHLLVGLYDEWAVESFGIVKTKLYPASLIRDRPPSKQYRRMTARVAAERITLAGYRIAAALNKALDD